MNNAIITLPEPVNEPVYSYRRGSPEREAVKAALADLKSREREIPLIIGGKEVRTGRISEIRPPHEHSHLLGTFHEAGPVEVEQAIENALSVRPAWERMGWLDRLAIFQRAAELIAGPWRARLNAATMLGQSKTVHQAEIDSACELVDFLRFNAHFASRIYARQPGHQPGTWNLTEHRGLEGFVFAVTPFNFTAIAGNLPTSAALMGNVVLWKPASTAIYSGAILMDILQEAGLPDGVIQFLPGPGKEIGDTALAHPAFAGIHFTGGTGTFNSIWSTIGQNIGRYRTYPRIVGETGGKDFILVHSSADPTEVTTAAIRGAFEYQGQKCSAASRMYVPSSLWPQIREMLISECARIKVGNVEDFGNFMGAVIDQKSFRNICIYLDALKSDSNVEIITGGKVDESLGWFVEPTIAVTTNPASKTMQEEIFGPVLTIFVYADENWLDTITLCDQTSPYALTGAVFARNRKAVVEAREALRHAAGNFYINDKPTGAVVGRQPFGGARSSGTNDKAGDLVNLLRWVSPRTIKETFVPARDWRYEWLDGSVEKPGSAHLCPRFEDGQGGA